jgi:hypothetical protein
MADPHLTDARERRWFRSLRAVQAVALAVSVVAVAIAVTNAATADPDGATALPSPTASAAPGPVPPTRAARPTTSSPNPTTSPITGAATGIPAASGCPPSAVTLSPEFGTLTWNARFAPGPPDAARCRNATIQLFWASYITDPAGNLLLHASEVFRLNATNASARFTIVIRGQCGWRYYVVIGDFAVKATVPAQDVGYPMLQRSGPYWDWSRDRNGAVVQGVGRECSTMPPSVTPAPSSEPSLNPSAEPSSA